MSKKKRYKITIYTYKKSVKQVDKLHNRLLKKFGKHTECSFVEVDKG